MRLDDIISLLLFLVFIVVPLLSRASRGPKKPGQQRPAQPRPGQSAGRGARGQAGQPNQRQVGRPRAGQASVGQQPSSPPPIGQPPPQASGDEFSRRLEEARRRVREAMESDPGGRQRPPAEAQAGSESASDLFRPSAPPQSQVPPLVTEPSLVSSRPISTSFLPSESQTSFSSLTERKKMATTKPLEVQRRVGAKQAKQLGPLQFGEGDIMRGIIWKQILDDPRAKQSWRQQSQRR